MNSDWTNDRNAQAACRAGHGAATVSHAGMHGDSRFKSLSLSAAFACVPGFVMYEANTACSCGNCFWAVWVEQDECSSSSICHGSWAALCSMAHNCMVGRLRLQPRSVNFSQLPCLNYWQYILMTGWAPMAVACISEHPGIQQPRPTMAAATCWAVADYLASLEQ